MSPTKLSLEHLIDLINTDLFGSALDEAAAQDKRFAAILAETRADSYKLPQYQPTFSPKGPRAPLAVRGEGEGRHYMMMSEIAAMWDGKMTEEEFLEKIQPINLKYCDPPKSEAKLLSQIKWIMQKEPCAAQGPKVFLGSQVEVEETEIELPPDVVPRHISARVDYIDQLAHELTSGTHLPFNYARELIKLMLLASLPSTRPRLEWFPVHTRQYLILISDTPGTGKSEAFRRVAATFEKAGGEDSSFRVNIIQGDLLGSPQYAVSELGGTVTKPGKGTK